MSKIDLTSNEWINLVFDGKNQEYGAYQFRKDSPRRHFIALIITFAIVLVLFLLPVLINVVSTTLGRVVVVETTALTDLETAEPETPPEEQVVEVIPQEIRNQIRFEIILTETEVTEEIRTVEEIVEDTRAIGTMDINTGTDNPEIQELVTEAVQPETVDKPYDYVEEMPEFVGGQAAMMAYINRNIRYPAAALEGGIQGKVYVRFVVDKTGKITQVEVQRSVHSLLDKEAVRVIQSMPDWKPGRQNGAPVKVYFSVPVNFKIQ